MFEIKDHILIKYHAPITEEEREAMRRAEEEAEAKKHVKHTAASAWDLGTESGPTAWGMRKRDAEEKIDPDSILVEDGDPEGRFVAVPEDITAIADSAFFECRKIESLTLPEGLKTIGADAFHGCLNLERAVIPDSVESIGENAFQWCSRLE